MWSLRSNALGSPSPMNDKNRFSNPLISTGYFRFVLGRRVVNVETTALEDLRAEVRVRVDDDLVWNSVEPAWGGLGFGVIQVKRLRDEGLIRKDEDGVRASHRVDPETLEHLARELSRLAAVAREEELMAADERRRQRRGG